MNPSVPQDVSGEVVIVIGTAEATLLGVEWECRDRTIRTSLNEITRPFAEEYRAYLPPPHDQIVEAVLAHYLDAKVIRFQRPQYTPGRVY